MDTASMTTTTEAMRLALEALELSKEQLAGDRLELIACHAWPAGSGEIPEHDRAGTHALREYDECLTASDAAIAALRAAMADDGWRPIETAPKDGTLFIGWVGAERWSAPDGESSSHAHDTSQSDFCWWRTVDGSPDGGYFDNGAGQIGDTQGVTHWMQLPAAPKD